MKLSPRLRMNANKVITITIWYVLINLFITYFNDTILNSPFSLGPSAKYYFSYTLRSNLIVGLITGLVGGSSLVFINSFLFRKKSFRFALLSTGTAYLIVFLIISFVTAVINTLPIAQNSITGIAFIKLAFTMWKDITMFSYFILWGFVTVFTLFLLQVNDKFGPGTLGKFLLGKYHQPREEERIFMFLDMRSSTSIAEKIGHAKYFNLLSDLFRDITDTILNNEGEIYQYVGDEVVISWPLDKGISKAHCLKCFLEIQKKLTELAPTYIMNYKVAPEMKAGLHCGKVIAGEIGSIKKDIVYSGDVLNTTARIQEQCNHYKVDLLLSSDVAELIIDQHQYEIEELGKIELRGKKSEVRINTIKLD